MELKDFTTLELAQSYEVTTYKDITVGAATQFFGLTGLLDNLETSSADTTPIVLSESMTTTVGALCRTILNGAKTTGFVADPTTNDGAINRAASQMLVAAGVFTQPLVDAFWDKSVVISKPYENVTQPDFDEAKDLGEVLTLPQNNAQHKTVVSITTKPRKPTTVKIQQRFGQDSNDLTEWHDIGQVSCLYTQRTYESGLIPTSPAAYRELRLVSPLTLGLSIV